jgi:hypothetical protein
MSMVSLPKPAEDEPSAQSDNPGRYSGEGHDAEEVPETDNEIPPIDLGCDSQPRKWRRADESNQEPAVGREILYCSSAQVIELRHHIR